LSAGVSLLHQDLDILPGSIDSAGGNDPAYQASLRSSMDLTRNLEWNVGLRVVDKLSGVAVPGYTEANTQLAWRVTDMLTLALVGSNLLHDHHLEGLNGAPLEIPRSVYFGARTQF
jgi:iron complex outermembrane receptor protein